MTGLSTLGLPTWIALLLGIGIAVVGAESIRRRNISAAVNAGVALAVAGFPLVLAFGTGTSLNGMLPPWIALAGFLHAVGMLGIYESVFWWDHLTHVVSAALLATAAYAGLLVAVDPAGVLSAGAVAAGTVLLVFGLGVFWELIELLARAIAERYQADPVLVYYGPRDTALDLVFDVVGAVLVVALDLRLFVPVAERFGRTSELLLVASGLLALGSVLVAPFADWSEDRSAR